MNKNNTPTTIPLSSLGNFTKHAVKNFEEAIVKEHNYLEKVNDNLKK